MSTATLLNPEEIQANLDHPDQEIRLQAVKDLVALQNPEFIEMLAKLDESETDVQVRYEIRKGISVLRKILSLREPGQAGEFTQNLLKVEKALRSEQEEKINKAFRYIVQYRLKQFLPVMEEIASQSGSNYQKNVLIRFMVSLGGEAYFNKIIHYLSDEDPRVISTAIEALESIGNTKALGYLAQFVTHEHNRVQATAMKALYNLGDQSALKLFQKMVGSPHEAYRNSAAYALKEMKIPKSLPLLKTLLEDECESVREKALEGVGYLAKQGLEAAQNLLDGQEEKLSKEPSWTNKNIEQKLDEIRQLLEKARDGSGKETFSQFQSHLEAEEDSKVIASLISAMGRIGSRDKQEASAVQSYLSHKDDRVRANAVETMGQLLPISDLASLSPLLDDHNNRVIGNAIMALFDHERDKCVSALKALCQSGNLKEQLTAVYCQGVLCDDDCLQWSEYLLESPFTEVREKMFKTLEDLGQDSVTALRLLKQYSLRMASFEPQDKEESAKEDENVPIVGKALKLPGASPVDVQPSSTAKSSASAKPAPSGKPKPKKVVSPRPKPGSHPLYSSDPGEFLQELHKLSLVALGIAFVLILGINGLGILVMDSHDYYLICIRPLRMILPSDFLFATFFYLVVPGALGWFLFQNKDRLFQESLVFGALVGLFLHQYVQALELLRLPLGHLFNFFAHDTAQFYLEYYSGNSRWALQVLNLPWFFLPLFLEGILRLRNLSRILMVFLFAMTLAGSFWLVSLNSFAQKRRVEVQRQQILSNLIQKRNDIQALMEQNDLDATSDLARLNKARTRDERLYYSRKVNRLRNQSSSFEKQIEVLNSRIGEVEDKIGQ